MITLYFKILGIPGSKQSARFKKIGGHIQSYQKQETVQQEQNIAWQIRQQLPPGFIPTKNPVMVKDLLFVFPMLSAASKKHIELSELGELFPKSTKPDLQDNLCKMLFDAMQGIVYVNDSQIWKIENSRKMCGSIPRIEFSLEF